MQLRTLVFSLCLLSLAAWHVPTLHAHCQIPCGIYDDQLRSDLIAEHATTIEKAMRMITKLSSADTPLDRNQLVRWVMNKESHAEEAERIVSYYFMTQRIKPDAEKYTEKITVLHQMLLALMRCKQSVDLEAVTEVRRLLKKFEVLYFGHSHRS
ncbi:MAG: superoxide dismutase [Ni] [Desulfosarcinaceae bacterium]|nr:superoxide dismutase [Ni] [Desulfosarcinaceae bacterium]